MSNVTQPTQNTLGSLNALAAGKATLGELVAGDTVVCVSLYGNVPVYWLSTVQSVSDETIVVVSLDGCEPTPYAKDTGRAENFFFKEAIRAPMELTDLDSKPITYGAFVLVLAERKNKAERLAQLTAKIHTALSQGIELDQALEIAVILGIE